MHKQKNAMKLDRRDHKCRYIYESTKKYNEIVLAIGLSNKVCLSQEHSDISTALMMAVIETVAVEEAEEAVNDNISKKFFEKLFILIHLLKCLDFYLWLSSMVRQKIRKCSFGFCFKETKYSRFRIEYRKIYLVL